MVLVAGQAQPGSFPESEQLPWPLPLGIQKGLPQQYRLPSVHGSFGVRTFLCTSIKCWFCFGGNLLQHASLEILSIWFLSPLRQRHLHLGILVWEQNQDRWNLLYLCLLSLRTNPFAFWGPTFERKIRIVKLCLFVCVFCVSCKLTYSVWKYSRSPWCVQPGILLTSVCLNLGFSLW